MADEKVERDDFSKSIVQGPDHGLSGRECTYQTPDAGIEGSEEDE